MLQGVDQIKNKTSLIFRHIQCLHSMNFEVAWVLVSLGNQVSHNNTQSRLPFRLYFRLLRKIGYRKITADSSNYSLDHCDGLVGNYNDTYHHSVVKKLTDDDYSALLENFESDNKNPKFSVNQTLVKRNICYWFCVKHYYLDLYD